jgi:nucleoid-associated protein YgaU
MEKDLHFGFSGEIQMQSDEKTNRQMKEKFTVIFSIFSNKIIRIGSITVAIIIALAFYFGTYSESEQIDENIAEFNKKQNQSINENKHINQNNRKEPKIPKSPNLAIPKISSKNVETESKTQPKDEQSAALQHTAKTNNKEKICDKIYVVKEGDTLWTIAKKCYGSSVKWEVIYKANQDKIGTNHLLHPKDELVIPEIQN